MVWIFLLVCRVVLVVETDAAVSRESASERGDSTPPLPLLS